MLRRKTLSLSLNKSKVYNFAVMSVMMSMCMMMYVSGSC